MTENIPPTPPATEITTPPGATPPPLPAAQPAAVYYAPPPRRSSFARMIFRVLAGFIFLMSIVINIYLAAALVVQIEAPFTYSTIRPGKEAQTIAVYEIKGVLDGKAAAHMQRFCKEVMNDKNVKAVVLRVDSPGGSVGASDQMYKMVHQLKTKGLKKVVVSMGAVAASGGYYISAAAHEIVAEPTTVTGSIGVLMNWLVVKGTMDKLGVESMLLKSTGARGWKDEISPFRKPDERQRKHLQAILDKLQDRFETVVRLGRGVRLKERKVTYPIRVGTGEDARTVQHTEIEPLNGKVYLPDEAKEFGLIDRKGYLSDAIDRAKALADLDEPRVIRYKRRKKLMEELLGVEGPAGLKLDAAVLDRLQTPRLLMLWKVE